MQLNRLYLQFFAFLFGVLAVYASVEPLTEGEDFYVFAQPADFYTDNGWAYGPDSRAKRYASSLRFGKRAQKGWSSSLRFG
ncbi:hypothetical protein M3Y97_00214300 [Aphelenchoides bicaudatus]|nr:hypothetical protein M3Y97_00214300 [Aphelenchoides bicaudatus]